MKESILKAYVGLARNTYPDKSRQNDDESMFKYAVEKENDAEILEELKIGLETEFTSKLLEFRQKERKRWFRSFFANSSRTNRTLPEGKIYERAISLLSGRITEIQQCGW